MSRRRQRIIPQETPSSSSEKAVDVIIIKEEFDDVCFNVFQKPSPEQINIINTFPWISEFVKLCQNDIGIINMKSLLKLMKFYIKNASSSVNECYSRPNRATKLKKALSDALMFFHMTYSAFRLPNDHITYLQNMSDLMAMYLDMEIKASRTGAESLYKVASKITSSLNIYFGKSTEYIFDTILKARMITKNARVLCDLIFRWVLRDSPEPYVDGISFIRHLLVFKIWKAITRDPEEKQKILKLACKKLQPPPGLAEKLNSSKDLRGILPIIPKNCPDVMDFLMRAKFCSRDQIKLFLEAADDPVIFVDWQPVSSINHSSEIEQNDKSGFGNIMDDIWSDLSAKPPGFCDMFNSSNFPIIECKEDEIDQSEKDDLDIPTHPNPLLQNLLIQDDEISKSEIDSFDNPEADRDFQNVESVYNEDIVCHEESIVTRGFSPPKIEPEPQERIRKFKTPAELKLQLTPPLFYEQDIIKLALTAKTTKRKPSTPDPPPPPAKGRRKAARRKSPRTRKGSLQKIMSSALEDMECTDNWIESST